jgi:hypothetical protein
LSAANLVQLTATITDNDDDTDTATLNIGQSLNFEDDGPSISTTGTPPELTVDETVLATNDSASFAANFSGAGGADGEKSTTYALSVSVSGVDSGLIDVATGNSVFLFVIGGDVVGLEGTDATDAFNNGETVFTVSVDGSGVVTLDQQRALDHPDDTDPDDSVTLSAANLVQLTATITDNDDDTDTATLNIGQSLNFEDDWWRTRAMPWAPAISTSSAPSGRMTRAMWCSTPRCRTRSCSRPMTPPRSSGTTN